MPIVHPAAPFDGIAILRPHIQSILGRPSPAAIRTLGSVAPNHLSISDPHRCYFVGLEDLVQGRLLDAAKPGSWRYLLLAADNPIADAEILDNGTQGLEFASVGYGRMAASSVNAMHIAETLSAVQTDDYEVRCLKIPALYFVAMWFHGHTNDIIVPIEPTPLTLATHQPYSESRILPLLINAAIAKKQAYDADTSGKLGG